MNVRVTIAEAKVDPQCRLGARILAYASFITGILFASLGVLLGIFLLGAPTADGSSIATLSGKITDQTGAAIPNASVSLFSSERIVKKSTDDEGKFEFRDLLPGTYELEVSARGFKTKVKEGVKVKDKAVRPLVLPLDVRAAGSCGEQPPPSYEQPATGAATLVGVVRTYDGGAPLASARLSLSKAGGTRVLTSQVSNEAGEFKFEHLEPGKYSLRAAREDYQEVSAIKFWITRENVTRLTIDLLELGKVILCA